MSKRYVITAGEWGIYFGQMQGMGFFSLIDAAGLPGAPTFERASEAHAFVRKWVDQPETYDVVAVECLGSYAMLWELDRAGLGHLLGNTYAEFLKFVPASGSA